MDHPQRAQRGLDGVLEYQPYDAHRNRAQDDSPAEGVVRVVTVFFVGQTLAPCDDDAHDVRPEIQNGGNDRTNLNDRGEGSDPGTLDVVPQQLLHDTQMSGAGNRQELGDALDYAEDDGVQPVHG